MSLASHASSAGKGRGWTIAPRELAVRLGRLSAVGLLVGMLIESLVGSVALAEVEDALPASSQPAVRAWLEPSDGVSLGDPVTLRVVATTLHAKDDIAVPKQSFDGLLLTQRRVQVEADPKGGGQRFVFRLELVPIETGERTVGPVALRVVTHDGQLGEVQTQALRLRVRSRLANEPNPKPKGAKAPVEVVVDDFTLLYVVGGLLALACVVLLIWWLARRWPRRERVVPSMPPRPPWEVARERLAALRRELDKAMRDDPQRGPVGTPGAQKIDAGALDLVAWVDRLSDTLREYLGARFAFEGLESTSDEVLSALRHLPAPHRAQAKDVPLEALADAFAHADLVKFAKAAPTRERCAEMLDLAESIVSSTAVSTASAPGVGPGSPPAAGSFAADASPSHATAAIPVSTTASAEVSGEASGQASSAGRRERRAVQAEAEKERRP